MQDFIFPAYDIRFIAVNDDVDSAKGENDFAVFKNVFNDYYAKDTSSNTNPKVHIYRYITAETFDAYMYQTLESKQRFISQIMTSKTPARTAADVDEAALSYAEIKALALGDPTVKERVDLENEVQRLRLLKQNYLYGRRDLEAALRRYPEEEAKLRQRINGFTADIAAAKEHTLPDGQFEMTVEGVLYTDRTEAAKALLNTVLTIAAGSGTVGTYKGFELRYTYLESSDTALLTFVGVFPHQIELGGSASGNLLRLDNAIDNLAAGLDDNQRQLADLLHEKKAAEIEIQKPFEKETELTEKARRLEELSKHFESGSELTVEEGEEVAPFEKQQLPSPVLIL